MTQVEVLSAGRDRVGGYWRLYIGGHAGGGYGRTSFSNPCGPSIYGGIVDTPAFLAGGQIGYKGRNVRLGRSVVLAFFFC
ncbi:hypothetical protein ACVWZK_009406 [Bradyrhizobium sp. GM0.4]|uniref:hypothetical protein n=1 Tax=unclassified Bradyrhizobium TaxID=2631580 RepID=UPI001FFB891F|nr:MULTISPECIES: hypothetical protein [unclassified Bradyrhizobium]